MTEATPRVTLKHVMAAAAKVGGITLAELTGRNRCTSVIPYRQAAQWIGVKHIGLSTPVIGRMFGRDHSTVVASVQKIERLRQQSGPHGKTERLLEAIWWEAQVAAGINAPCPAHYEPPKIHLKRKRKARPVQTVLGHHSLYEIGSHDWFDAQEDRARCVWEKAFAEGERPV